MFGMLEVGFSRHPVTRASRIAAKLEIFFEKLLGGTPHSYVRAMAVKNVVPVHRNLAVQLPGRSIAPARTMMSGPHPLYIHGLTTALSCSWHFTWERSVPAGPVPE
jgi:hypothetical protein